MQRSRLIYGLLSYTTWSRVPADYLQSEGSEPLIDEVRAFSRILLSFILVAAHFQERPRAYDRLAHAIGSLTLLQLFVSVTHAAGANSEAHLPLTASKYDLAAASFPTEIHTSTTYG
jgi:hypothetical protein